MAEGKKGFILYADQKEIFEQLTDIKAGQLIKHIFKYVNDEDPKTKDAMINLAFTPIKLQLKRDLTHWENIRQKRSEAGKKGGRPKKQNKANKANGFFDKQTKAKKAVTVNVNVKDNVIVNDKYKSYSFFDDDFSDTWNEYLQMRKHIKKPATPKAEIIALNKLQKLSDSDKVIAKQIVENSILNSWQGIFPLNDENKSKQINNW